MSELSEEDLGELAKAVTSILSNWGISASDQLVLLAMPEEVRSRHMQKFRQGEPLPNLKAVLDRVDHIIGIAEALRTTFPQNAHMAKFWLQQPHRRFDNETPMKCIMEDGLEGLLRVRCHLDCAYDWQQDDARAAARNKNNS